MIFLSFILILYVTAVLYFIQIPVHNHNCNAVVYESYKRSFKVTQEDLLAAIDCRTPSRNICGWVSARIGRTFTLSS